MLFQAADQAVNITLKYHHLIKFKGLAHDLINYQLCSLASIYFSSLWDMTIHLLKQMEATDEQLLIVPPEIISPHGKK